MAEVAALTRFDVERLKNRWRQGEALTREELSAIEVAAPGWLNVWDAYVKRGGSGR